jgi:tetratricopeptide (TPR) repeat protein
MKNNEIIEYSRKIDSYLNGRLGRDEIDELWLDFLKKPELYDYFEIELHLKNLILKNQRDVLDKKGNRSVERQVVYLVIVAAALFLVVFGLNHLIFNQAGSIERLAITSIDTNELVASNILRSDDQFTDLAEVEMNRAIADAYNQNYEDSITRLHTLLQTGLNESQKVIIEMNLGILNYNLKEFETAENHFLNVLNGSSWASEIYSEQAWWYLANNFLQMNRLFEARRAARKVADFEGSYQPEAEELLIRSERFMAPD